MTKSEWKSQFANDPTHGFDLYLELLKGDEPQAKIERDADGELYLSLFACPRARIPFRWLMSLSARAETLPAPEAEDLTRS